MGFKDLDLKSSYSSDIDNILLDFYIPVLKETKEYYRLTGFFSSSSLAIASKGIAGLIKNNGKMNLLVSPKIREKDKDIIMSNEQKVNEIITENFISEIDNLEEEIFETPLKAFGWMLANNILKLKVALIYDKKGDLLNSEEIEKRGVFHQKVGIFYDSDKNSLSFSGSVNESAYAWLNNIEEFKVFKEWVDGQNEFYLSDLNKFNRFWSGNSHRVKTTSFPNAVANKLIELAPNDFDDIDWDSFYKLTNNKSSKKSNKEIELFEHQKEAVNEWLDNNKKGLFVMATGTGKTYAALGCLREVNKRYSNWVCIITCPQSHLLDQWMKEIKKFDINYDKLIRADSNNPGYKNKMANLLMGIRLDKHNNLIIVTTHSSFSKKQFRQIIKEHKYNSKLFLIADEVHGVGSEKRSEGLIDDYDFRLGLSATPKRWFDDEGTDIIYNYFNDDIYEFGIKRALSEYNPLTNQLYLTPYDYIPCVIELTNDELQEYVDKTMEYIKTLNMFNDEDKEIISKIKLIQRADIVKSAENKFSKLEDILDDLGSDLKDTIIYCNHLQINRVMRILNSRKIKAHTFTENEGTVSEQRFNGVSEREHLIELFSSGELQVLVAINCLNEGVDIPSASKGIIMASSTNPREYIQRIGRVLRRSENKTKARIYDFIVAPSSGKLPEKIRKIEQKIFNKELERAMEICENARNNAEIYNYLEEIRK